MAMETRILGRTGLRVTAMGLGSGGHSKLGLARGGDPANAVSVVRHAMDLGINVLDSAEGYKTEAVVGEAIQGRRDQVVLATKTGVFTQGRVKTPDEIEQSIDNSLRKLRTDVIDIYQAHGVGGGQYDQVARHVVPVLEEMREKGKLRYIGITEAFGGDTTHRMLTRAVKDDCWDTIMVGFNFMNPSARKHVLPMIREKNIGVFCMFAIRNMLTNHERARALINQLIEEGIVDGSKLNRDAPLDFLIDESCDSIAEAAYRFCLHEPGLDCILSGTGSVEHLDENFQSLSAPPLSDAVLARLNDCFGHVDSVSCN